MSAGKLDQRVVFERYDKIEDGMGGFAEDWKVLNTVWARVVPLSGRERDVAQQLNAMRNYRIQVRRTMQTGQLTEADRIRWNGKRLNIHFIADKGSRAKYMYIDAEMEQV